MAATRLVAVAHPGQLYTVAAQCLRNMYRIRVQEVTFKLGERVPLEPFALADGVDSSEDATYSSKLVPTEANI